MDDNTKQFLIQKYADYWAKENPELVSDIGDLCAKVVMFNAKWGAGLTLTFKEEPPNP